MSVLSNPRDDLRGEMARPKRDYLHWASMFLYIAEAAAEFRTADLAAEVGGEPEVLAAADAKRALVETLAWIERHQGWSFGPNLLAEIRTATSESKEKG